MYNKSFVSYNVHLSIHLKDDVIKYGPLKTFSCFPFENFLGKLKRKVRGQKLQLQKVYNRLTEIKNITDDESDECFLSIKAKKIFNKSLEWFQCKKLITRKFHVSVNPPDIVCGKKEDFSN